MYQDKTELTIVIFLLFSYLLCFVMNCHAQTPRGFDIDLNRTPSPEPQNDASQHSDNHPSVVEDPQNTIDISTKEPKRWTRKPRTDKTGKSERQKELYRESSRRYRKRIRERQLNNNLTESDKAYFENMKKRKRKYTENHKEEIKDYNSQWRQNNQEYNNERSKKWRKANLERVRQREKVYRDQNRIKIRANRVRSYYKTKQKQMENRSKADEK